MTYQEKTLYLFIALVLFVLIKKLLPGTLKFLHSRLKAISPFSADLTIADNNALINAFGCPGLLLTTLLRRIGAGVQGTGPGPFDPG